MSGGLDAVERWTAIGVSIKKRAQKGLFAGSKYSKMERGVSVYLWHGRPAEPVFKRLNSGLPMQMRLVKGLYEQEEVYFQSDL